jgi:ATP synthase F1 delta subunit
MNIQTYALARKYAKAFLNYRGDVLTPSSCERIKKALAEFQQYPAYSSVLKIPTIADKIKQETLLAWFKTLNIPIDITSLLKLLAVHQRLFLFPFILQQLCAEYYARNNIETFSIQSTIPLQQEHIDTIHAFLEYKTGKRVQSTQKIHAPLLAGVRLQSENFLWEYSVRQRLRNIAKISINEKE